MRGRELRSRGPGAGWFAWWWIWLVVILCAVWFAGWGWGGYGGWWWGNRGTVSTNGYPGTGTPNAAATGSAGEPGTSPGSGATENMNLVTGSGAAVLIAADKRSFIGKPFQVNDAVVTRVVSGQAIWIGQSSNNNTSMLVVLNPSAKAKVSAGDLVNVTGIVRKAPAAAQARQNWKLSADGQKRLGQQGAYVAATRVQRTANGNNG